MSVEAHLPVPSPTRPVDSPDGSQSDHVTAQRVPSALHCPRMTPAPLVDKALLLLFSVISHCSPLTPLQGSPLNLFQFLGLMSQALSRLQALSEGSFPPPCPHRHTGHV